MKPLFSAADIEVHRLDLREPLTPATKAAIGEALLAELMEFITQDDYVYSHAWQPGGVGQPQPYTLRLNGLIAEFPYGGHKRNPIARVAAQALDAKTQPLPGIRQSMRTGGGAKSACLDLTPLPRGLHRLTSVLSKIFADPIDGLLRLR